jgi:hypothetical protein
LRTGIDRVRGHPWDRVDRDPLYAPLPEPG